MPSYKDHLCQICREKNSFSTPFYLIYIEMLGLEIPVCSECEPSFQIKLAHELITDLKIRPIPRRSRASTKF